MGRSVEFDIVKLDINGRVRIPAEVREKFGWTKGQKFKIEVDEETGRITLIPIRGAVLKAVTADGEEIEIIDE